MQKPESNRATTDSAGVTPGTWTDLIQCPKLPNAPWGYDHCRLRFAMAAAFPDNGCLDCPVHLQRWVHRQGISI